MKKKLEGIKIAVTRPHRLSSDLGEKIIERGGIPFFLPGVTIKELSNTALKAKKIVVPDIIIFVSRNAAEIGGKILLECSNAFKTKKIFAVGVATAQELTKLGYQEAFAPLAESGGKSLSEHPALISVKNCDILLVKGVGGKTELADILESRGAKIQHFSCYERILPEWSSASINLVNSTAIQAWLATSGEIIDNIFDMSDKIDVEVLRRTPWFVNHVNLLETATIRHQIKEVLLTEGGDSGLVRGLETWFFE
tara:strand:- start:122 stop:880 length:759 start_codon:yes stop_codon:yes gene_type:complete